MYISPSTHFNIYSLQPHMFYIYTVWINEYILRGHVFKIFTNRHTKAPNVDISVLYDLGGSWLRVWAQRMLYILKHDGQSCWDHKAHHNSWKVQLSHSETFSGIFRNLKLKLACCLWETVPFHPAYLILPQPPRWDSGPRFEWLRDRQIDGSYMCSCFGLH